MADTFSIELALISSLFQATNETVIALQIKEEYFQVPLHKLAVKCVLWLISKDKEFDEEIVLYYIAKNNNINLEEWLHILAANPFATVGTMKSYLDILKEQGKRRVDEI